MIANVAPVGASRNATALYTVHNIVDQADIPCSWMSEVGTNQTTNTYPPTAGAITANEHAVWLLCYVFACLFAGCRRISTSASTTTSAACR